MYHMAAVGARGLLLLCPREGHAVPNCQHKHAHLSERESHSVNVFTEESDFFAHKLRRL